MIHYVFTAKNKLYDIKADDYREALQQLADRILSFEQRNTPLEDVQAGKVFEFKLERTYTE